MPPGMHAQFAARRNNRLSQQFERPLFFQRFGEIDFLTGEEPVIEPASGPEIFRGREKKSSGAEIRGGEIERGENVNENAAPERYFSIDRDARAAAKLGAGVFLFTTSKNFRTAG